MSHTIQDKVKLVHRVKKIQGQVNSVLRSLESEAECSEILQRIAAARGAMDSLMSEVLEGHIRQHVLADVVKPAARTAFAEDLIDVVRAYLK